MISPYPTQKPSGGDHWAFEFKRLRSDLNRRNDGFAIHCLKPLGDGAVCVPLSQSLRGWGCPIESTANRLPLDGKTRISRISGSLRRVTSTRRSGHNTARELYELDTPRSSRRRITRPKCSCGPGEAWVRSRPDSSAETADWLVDRQWVSTDAPASCGRDEQNRCRPGMEARA